MHSTKQPFFRWQEIVITLRLKRVLSSLWFLKRKLNILSYLPHSHEWLESLSLLTRVGFEIHKAERWAAQWTKSETGMEKPLALLPCLFSLWACKNKPPASASGPNRRQGAFVSLTTFETAGQSVEEWQSQSSSHICSSLRVWVLRLLTDQHYTPT